MTGMGAAIFDFMFFFLQYCQFRTNIFAIFGKTSGLFNVPTSTCTVLAMKVAIVHISPVQCHTSGIKNPVEFTSCLL